MTNEICLRCGRARNVCKLNEKGRIRAEEKGLTCQQFEDYLLASLNKFLMVPIKLEGVSK